MRARISGSNTSKPLLARQLLLAVAGAVVFASAVALGIVVLAIAALLITVAWAGWVIWFWWRGWRGTGAETGVSKDAHGTVVEGEYEVVNDSNRPGPGHDENGRREP